MRLTATRKTVTACVVASALALALAAPTTAFAVTSAEKQAEAQAVLASLNTMQAQLDQASNDHYLAVEAQQQAEADAQAAQTRIDEASAEIADLQSRLGTRAHSMYKEGNSTFLDLILGATTFSEFTSRWDLLVSINQNDTDLVNETKALRTEIEEQKAVLDEQTRVAAEKAEEAARIEADAQATVAAMESTYNSLSAEVAALLEQERAAQEAAQAARADQVLAAAAQSAQAAQTAQAVIPQPTTDAIAPETTYTQPSGGGSYETMDSAAAEQLVSSGGGTIVGYDANTGNAIVDRAYAALGTAYSYGACSQDAFDCSGFVSYALTGGYDRLGSTTTFMSNYQQVSDPQPGDIAVNDGHCGIYVGDGKMVHAATYGVGVVEGAVQDGMIFVRPN
ncbi:coiled-coil domain-containing protein [Xiamenia xianingshaonis]|uniref:C40 family peptidase n=1 Tax=Xiamenia xianingshaonis TaxID=2682776 RepID=A0A9E6SUQ9_9ACTN|nr:NlpC/P60 family protein [Xiamenia xianingshaonis]NHM14852.1 hydrolase Nlp/P60 [Xiamenia xianingshaonis]QTU84743.1 C40 family peptidase [Xiamenia xianingshaonis]